MTVRTSKRGQQVIRGWGEGIIGEATLSWKEGHPARCWPGGSSVYRLKEKKISGGPGGRKKKRVCLTGGLGRSQSGNNENSFENNESSEHKEGGLLLGGTSQGTYQLQYRKKDEKGETSKKKEVLADIF